MAAKSQLYTDAKGEFRWKLAASNGQTIATSGEGYKSKDSAKPGIESVKKNAPKAAIEERQTKPAGTGTSDEASSPVFGITSLNT